MLVILLQFQATLISLKQYKNNTAF